MRKVIKVFALFQFILASAFSSESCRHPVTVAVIDTGIDASHPLLIDHLWKHPSRPGVYGFDFVENKYNPKDDEGHGTHVSGLIVSISPCARILPIKYYEEQASGAVNTKRLVESIYYAIKNNADIINFSGGGQNFVEEEYLAIREARNKGILFISAAGNANMNLDMVGRHYYPASYQLDNIISVASVTDSDFISPMSNWGGKSVDFATQGVNIESSLPGEAYGKLSGTSMATALVSGYVSNMLSDGKKITFKKIRAELSKSVRPVDSLKNKVKSGGVLDLYKETRQPAWIKN